MDKHLNSQNTAVDIKHVIHHVSQGRILPRLTTQWCWFVDWDTIVLNQTNLQNGNTASTSRPFGHNVSQVALRYDERRSLQCSWNPYLCHHWRLTPLCYFMHLKSAKPPLQGPAALRSSFCRLTCSPCMKGGECLWYKQVLVSASVSNFGKWML